VNEQVPDLPIPPRCPPRCRGLAATLCALLALFFVGASSLSAQLLTGRVVEGAGGAPVSAALVELLDGDSVQVAAALSEANGEYRLAPARGGRYTVRVRRLGYASRTFGPLDLTGPQRFDIELATRPVELEGVVATAAPVCADGPGVGPETQSLWDLVVAALDVTLLVQQQDRYRFEMHRYVRDLSVERTFVLQEGVERIRETGAFTAMPLRTLERQGYVEADRQGNFSWYMPDPEVLVSNHFLRTHCFRVEDSDDPGEVGLRFDPMPDRRERRPNSAPRDYRRLFDNRVVEVRGVLWVDRQTGALRDMEYEYTGFRDPSLARYAGGYARFEQLRGGVWIVRQWLVRMPNLERAEDEFEVASIREVGGYVVDALDETATSAMEGGEDGDVVGRIAGGEISFAPERALVRLSGSPWATRPDAEGRFAFRDMPPGPYVIAWSSPRLDSLGIRPAGTTVEIAAGRRTEVDLAGPDFASAIDQICRGMPVTPELGAVRVVVAGGGVEQDRSRIRVRSATLRTVGPTDTPIERRTRATRGVATFCSLPTGVPLEVSVGDGPLDTLRFTLDPWEIRAIPLGEDRGDPPYAASTDGSGSAGAPN
jgi:hypothetical protein